MRWHVRSVPQADIQPDRSNPSSSCFWRVLRRKVGDHAPTTINVALPVGLIVNELLTNAFKHAFGGRGHGLITVWCLRHGADRYRVIVSDDGIGLPEGVIWPVPGKIGALVVQSLRENAKTDLNVESVPDRGLKVTMTFEHKLAPRKSN